MGDAHNETTPARRTAEPISAKAPGRNVRGPLPASARSRLARPAAGANLLPLQRLAGNGAVARLMAGPDAEGAALVQRLELQEGPPLAPGHYSYGTTIVGTDERSMKDALIKLVGSNGVPAEKQWQIDFVNDMRAVPDAKSHNYDDPRRKQTIKVEPTLATNAERAQQGIEDGVATGKQQFQQELLTMIGEMLQSSEAKLYAEAHRYGFPDDESIFNPKPVSVGQAALASSMPSPVNDALRGVVAAAKELVDGKRKLRAARTANANLGPLLGPMVRPNTLEVVARDYHSLRQSRSAEFPILASFERNDERLAELAAGAQFLAPGSGGPATTNALMSAQNSIRKDLADKLSSIAVVKAGMNEPDKVEKFWANPSLVSSAKRKMGIAPGSFPNAAVEDKVRELKEDAEFSAKIKTAVGIGLLVASLVPGVNMLAAGAGLVMAGADLRDAFQDFYWEQAAAGTAMDKAEAISQSEPDLFSLGVSIAVGMLEGVAEAKALEGAIGVFKAVSNAYREARTAAAVAEVASGSARGAGSAELLLAQTKLSEAVDAASNKPGLGARVVNTMIGDAGQMATDLRQALEHITDPALRELILKANREAPGEVSLADLAVADPARLNAEYAEWMEVEREGAKTDKGRRFVDWLRDERSPAPHGTITDPAGLLEYGLNRTEAHRSFEAMLAEDPSREAAIWRDQNTGEHVAVQGGHSFVEVEWMGHADNRRKRLMPVWVLEIHHHPNRGLLIDRLPSTADFNHITNGGTAQIPVRSRIAWTDPASKIRFESTFGFAPGAPRPFWARYRVEDGTMRVASFSTAPWAAGAAEYEAWVAAFSTDPGAAVPGGNVMPLSPVTSRPRLPGRNVPPPLPSRPPPRRVR